MGWRTSGDTQFWQVTHLAVDAKQLGHVGKSLGRCCIDLPVKHLWVTVSSAFGNSRLPDIRSFAQEHGCKVSENVNMSIIIQTADAINVRKSCVLFEALSWLSEKLMIDCCDHHVVRWLRLHCPLAEERLLGAGVAATATRHRSDSSFHFFSNMKSDVFEAIQLYVRSLQNWWLYLLLCGVILCYCNL